MPKDRLADQLKVSALKCVTEVGWNPRNQETSTNSVHHIQLKSILQSTCTEQKKIASQIKEKSG